MPDPARAHPGLADHRAWWFGLAVLVVGLLGSAWFLLPMAAPGSAVSAPPNGWSRYRAPDGSFDVVGPRDPSLISGDTTIGLEHELHFSAPDGQVLGVEWVDVTPEIAGRPESELMLAWANSLVQDLGGVLDEQDVLRAGAHPGVGLRLRSGGRSVYVRIFAAGGRLYEVASVLPATAPLDQRSDGERFVDSFELLV
jgi:hypothetical protein